MHIAQSSINCVSTSLKVKTGNEVREKPKKSKESPYKCTTFGIKLESRRLIFDLKWPPPY